MDVTFTDLAARWRYALVGSVAVLVRLVSLAGLVLAVRGLSPAAYGTYAIGWVVCQTGGQALSGFDQAFVDLRVREGGAAYISAYRRVKWVASAGLAAASLAVCAALGGQVAWVLAAAVLGGAVWSVFQTSLSELQAAERFVEYGLWTLAFNVCALALLAALLAGGARSPAILVLTQAAAGAVCLAAVRLRQAPAPPPAPGSTAGFVRRSGWLVVSSTLYSAQQRAELLIGGALLASGALAIYAAPARVFGILEFMLSAMGTVLLPRAAGHVSSAARVTYLREALRAAALVGAGGVAVYLLRAPLTDLLLGREYHASARLIPAFAVAAVALTAGSIAKYLLFSIERPAGLAVYNVALLLSKLLLAALLIPWLGALGVAWTLAGSYVVGDIVLAALLRGHVRQRAATR